MIQTDPIFLGVVPRAARSYVSQQVVCLGKPFFNACAGRFSVVEGAVKQGFPTAKVHTSDIGLFSSLIGYLTDDSKRLEDLGIRILDPGLASRRIRLLFSVRLRQSSYQSRKRSTPRPQSPRAGASEFHEPICRLVYTAAANPAAILYSRGESCSPGFSARSCA